MNESTLALMVVFAFFLLFAGGIYAAIRSERRRKETGRRLAVSLGFTPLDQPDPLLEEALIRLNRHQYSKDLKVRGLAYRRGLDDDIYLYDLWDTGGESSSRTVENGMAVRSAALALPRFAILPRIPGSGRVTGAANWLLEKVYERFNVEMLEFDDTPDFNARYVVLAAGGEEPVRAFLTPHLRRQLEMLQNVQISADGDMFSLESFVVKTARTEEDRLSALRRQLSDAGDIAGWFKDALRRE